AGPGGKAALLAALGEERGASLVANELQQHRSELVASALRRHPNARVRTGDGRTASWPPTSFDRVLVDAPCTGLGALRRRPEARWRRSVGDLPALTRLQSELLDSAVESVRRGGLIAYATCSPHRAETRGVVDRLRSGRDDLELVDAARALGIPGLAGPYVQLWPHVHGTDAMFLAILRRR